MSGQNLMNSSGIHPGGRDDTSQKGFQPRNSDGLKPNLRLGAFGPRPEGRGNSSSSIHSSFFGKRMSSPGIHPGDKGIHKKHPGFQPRNYRSLQCPILEFGFI